MDRVTALKKGSIYIEDKFPRRFIPEKINSQQATVLLRQLQTSVVVTSEEEHGLSEELTQAFGSIVALKDNKSLTNQVGKNDESKQKTSRSPLVAGDPGDDLNIENLEI